jgi:hypothetical protein
LTILRNAHRWKDISEIQTTEIFGKQELEKAQDLDVDRSLIRNNAVEGYAANVETLRATLRSETFDGIEKAFAGGEPVIDTDTWVDTVYEILAAYARTDDPIALLEALRAIYFGRTYTFMNETWEMSTAEAEEGFVAQARRFFEKRGDLLKMLE